jgi:hypothetical protein
MPESTYGKEKKKPKEGNSEGEGAEYVDRKEKKGVNGSSQLAGCGSSPVSGGSYSTYEFPITC